MDTDGRLFDGLAAGLQTHYRNMQDDLYDGLTPEVVEATNQALAWGQSPANILAHGLVAGMDAVGKDFGAGILFVPEVLRAAERDEGRDGDAAPAARRDRCAEGRHRGHRHREGRHPRHRQEPGGHDVGGRRVEGDQPGRQCGRRQVPSAIDEHNATLLGMSALLTTTMPCMLKVIERLEEEGLRERVKVLVGGAPLNPAFAEDVRADRYCRDAAEAVVAARAMVNRDA